MSKRRNAWIANYASMLALLCVFIIGSLALMNVGVHVYKNIVENNAENFRLRASLSYMATKVRQYDAVDTISVQEEEGVPMLVFQEEPTPDLFKHCFELQPQFLPPGQFRFFHRLRDGNGHMAHRINGNHSHRFRGLADFLQVNFRVILLLQRVLLTFQGADLPLHIRNLIIESVDLEKAHDHTQNHHQRH